MQYVEGIHAILTDCPNAHIIMSSILPRAGTNKGRVNSQICDFNNLIRNLAEEELNLHFCDNSVYFQEEEGIIDSLYNDSNTFGIHLNIDGRERLITSITSAIKEVYFHEKYVEASS